MENGAPRRNRTADPIITNDVLYQLSYRGSGGGFKGKGARAQGAVFARFGATFRLKPKHAARGKVIEPSP
ncbi:MAG: hypothetical protein FD144_985 [Rhodospirillaceae bacterium]|nr:MAG: hypothetical protein FD144_985 [Rhodospirillaceae bacterium]